MSRTRASVRAMGGWPKIEFWKEIDFVQLLLISQIGSHEIQLNANHLNTRVSL